jgi:hypothetical protein
MERTQEQTTQDLEITMTMHIALRLALVMFTLSQVLSAAVDCGNPSWLFQGQNGGKSHVQTS